MVEKNDFELESRLFRAITRLTFEEEAEILGVSESSLCKYQSGERYLSDEKHRQFLQIMREKCLLYCGESTLKALIFIKNMID